MAEKYFPIGSIPKTTKPISTGAKPKFPTSGLLKSPRKHLLARSPLAASSPNFQPLPTSHFKSGGLKIIPQKGMVSSPSSPNLQDAEKRIAALTIQFNELKDLVSKLKADDEKTSKGCNSHQELLNILTALPDDELNDLLSDLFDKMDRAQNIIKDDRTRATPILPVKAIITTSRIKDISRTPSPVFKKSSNRSASGSNKEAAHLFEQDQVYPSHGHVKTENLEVKKIGLSPTPATNKTGSNDWGDTSYDPWQHSMGTSNIPVADWGDNFDYSKYLAEQRLLLADSGKPVSDWEASSSPSKTATSNTTSDWEAEIAAYIEERRQAAEKALIQTNSTVPTSHPDTILTTRVSHNSGLHPSMKVQEPINVIYEKEPSRTKIANKIPPATYGRHIPDGGYDTV